jgi:hypothetical protein
MPLLCRTPRNTESAGPNQEPDISAINLGIVAHQMASEHLVPQRFEQFHQLARHHHLRAVASYRESENRFS